MTPDQLFDLVNTLALVSWLLLLVFPFKERVRQLLFGGTITGLSVLYAALFLSYFEPSSMSSFSTLDGLMGLFAIKEAVLIGWVHYLAFDLLAGLYISKDAEKNEISAWIIRPIFLMTFMAGPLGLLIYIIVRTIRSKKYHF